MLRHLLAGDALDDILLPGEGIEFGVEFVARDEERILLTTFSTGCER